MELLPDTVTAVCVNDTVAGSVGDRLDARANGGERDGGTADGDASKKSGATGANQTLTFGINGAKRIAPVTTITTTPTPTTTAISTIAPTAAPTPTPTTTTIIPATPLLTPAATSTVVAAAGVAGVAVAIAVAIAVALPTAPRVVRTALFLVQRDCKHPTTISMHSSDIHTDINIDHISLFQLPQIWNSMAHYLVHTGTYALRESTVSQRTWVYIQTHAFCMHRLIDRFRRLAFLHQRSGIAANIASDSTGGTHGGDE